MADANLRTRAMSDVEPESPQNVRSVPSTRTYTAIVLSVLVLALVAIACDIAIPAMAEAHIRQWLPQVVKKGEPWTTAQFLLAEEGVYVADSGVSTHAIPGGGPGRTVTWYFLSVGRRSLVGRAWVKVALFIRDCGLNVPTARLQRPPQVEVDTSGTVISLIK